MALFTYKAMNTGGRVVHGQLDAINLVDLEMRLKRMELDFINGNELRQSGLFRGGKLPKRELINFCFHMEQLTRAGVPILDSLTDLRDSLTHRCHILEAANDSFRFKATSAAAARRNKE